MTWKKRQQMTLDGKSTNHLEMQTDLRGKVSARGGGRKRGVMSENSHEAIPQRQTILLQSMSLIQ